jgi:hypothetical protein
MTSSSDSVIITIEPNTKENFWTAALFCILQKEKNMPEQNLHIFWNILRSGALSLLPYQFALLHVFSVLVVGWYFYNCFCCFSLLLGRMKMI